MNRHSSFLSGRSVLSAGEFVVHKGHLVKVSDRCQYYSISHHNFCVGLAALEDLGVHFDGVIIERFNNGDSVVDPRCMHEILDDDVPIRLFVKRHCLNNVTLEEAISALENKPIGSWNIIFFSEMQDYVVNFVDDDLEIESVFISDIIQFSHIIIKYLKEKRPEDLIDLDPFLGVTPDIYSQVNELAVIPFPVTSDYQFVSTYIKRQPKGSWLILESVKRGYVLVENQKGRVRRFRFSENRLNKLNHSLKISFSAGIKNCLKKIELAERIRKLNVLPFPQSIDKEWIHQFLKKQSKRSWLLYGSYIIGNVDGRVTEFDLDIKLLDQLERLNNDECIPFSPEVIDDFSRGVREDVARIMTLFTEMALGYRGQKTIQKQIQLALDFIRLCGEQFRRLAVAFQKPLYIRATHIMKKLGKSEVNVKVGKGFAAIYKAPHIQVKPDGGMCLIPKHPRLVLGEGGYKKVRTAVEIDSQNDPVRLVAFGSLYLESRNDCDEALAEVAMINQYLKTEAKAVGVDNPTLASFHIYREFCLAPGSGDKGKLVLPYANLGDLTDENYSRDDIPEILAGMVRCVQLMHHLKIANDDLKPENFLVHKTPKKGVVVRTFDFGRSGKYLGQNFEEVKGAKGWYSPEKLLVWAEILTGYHPLKADIFALGLSLWQVASTHKTTRDCYYQKGPKFHTNLIDKLAVHLQESLIQSYVTDYKKDWYLFEPQTYFEKLIKLMTSPIPHARPDIDTVARWIVGTQEEQEDVHKILDKKLDLYSFFGERMLGEGGPWESLLWLEGTPIGSWLLRYSVKTDSFFVMMKTGYGSRDIGQAQLWLDEFSMDFLKDLPKDKVILKRIEGDL